MVNEQYTGTCSICETRTKKLILLPYCYCGRTVLTDTPTYPYVNRCVTGRVTSISDFTVGTKGTFQTQMDVLVS